MNFELRIIKLTLDSSEFINFDCEIAFCTVDWEEALIEGGIVEVVESIFFF